MAQTVVDATADSKKERAPRWDRDALSL